MASGSETFVETFSSHVTKDRAVLHNVKALTFVFKLVFIQ